MSDYQAVEIDVLDYLTHFGVKRKSGAHPWGTGETPYQHEPWFTWGKNEWLNKYEEYKSNGNSNAEIAKIMGITPTELKTRVKNAKNDERIKMVSANDALIEAGVLNRSERARMMGVNESTVRSLENKKSLEKTNRAKKTAEILKEQIDTKGAIDISAGAEIRLGVSKDKLKQAVILLQEQGYEKYKGRNEQNTNKGKFTTTTVLCPPGTGHYNKEGKYVSDIVYHPERVNLIDIPGGIHNLDVTSDDGGETFRKSFQYPASMDSKRIFVRYKDEGGMENDGTIEIRPGVPDLNLGESHYAQVRILVDDNKYMKGMAYYSDDVPPGYDVVYNSKRTREQANKVFKDISLNPDNPFNSLIKENGGQSTYIDPVTGERKLSLINKRSDEGDWDDWDDKLPSQFLAKQKKELVSKQLKLSIDEKVDELNAIRLLDNPTIKKYYLIDFAQNADKTAVELKAAALPGQKYKVILPINSLKDNECYCPEYKDGTVLALVRYPHGGTFEIPIVKVNNKNEEAKKKLGTSPVDGLGINFNVASQLSGADFDGDTVMVIPNADKQHILSTHPLKGLEKFDPEESYGYGDTEAASKKLMDDKYNQIQMGTVTNLLMDMTLKGATDDEKAAVTRHSMVIIDCKKRKLDYTRSAKDNNIEGLKKKYQGHYDLEGNWKQTGASTIITRAKNEHNIPATQGDPKINPETGELEWKPKSKKVIDISTGETIEVPDPYYINKNGKKVYYTKKSNQMSDVDDAFKLVSNFDNPVEIAYAEYANTLKALANQARKESLNVGNLPYNKEAAKQYGDVIDILKDKIITAEANAPLERAAQRKSRLEADKKFALDPGLTEKEKGKIEQQELTKARLEYGAKRHAIDISDREWEAIQAGAISESMLKRIMNYADTDKLKQRAMPRSIDVLPSSKINRIQSMEASGYTISQIAERLDLSSSTVKKYLKVSVSRESLKN